VRTHILEVACELYARDEGIDFDEIAAVAGVKTDFVSAEFGTLAGLHAAIVCSVVETQFAAAG
jgi:hypothetical protein